MGSDVRNPSAVFLFLVRIFENTFRQNCLLRKIVVAFLLDIGYNKSKHTFAYWHQKLPRCAMDEEGGRE